MEVEAEAEDSVISGVGETRYTYRLQDTTGLAALPRLMDDVQRQR